MKFNLENSQMETADMALRNRVDNMQKLIWKRIALMTLLITSVAACASVSGTQNMRGIYYWGGEVESFSPCGSDQSFWVVGSERILQALRLESMRLSRERSEAFQPVYVEAIVIEEAKAEDGFAADYDGVYRFTSIKTFSSSTPSDCQMLPRRPRRMG